MAIKTREKLIDVARQLFVHKGVERTTMNDIAEASSKGRRTIYTYFKNKKEIYNAVLENESDRMVGELRAIGTEDRPVEDRLRRVLHKRLEQGQDVSSGMSSFKSLFKFDLRRMERIRRMVRDKEKTIISDLISEGISEGRFRPDRCRLLEIFLVKCLQGIDLAEIDQEDASKASFVNGAMVEFILSDILVTTPSTTFNFSKTISAN